jgi:hypothetical protein
LTTHPDANWLSLVSKLLPPSEEQGGNVVPNLGTHKPFLEDKEDCCFFVEKIGCSNSDFLSTEERLH